MGHSAGAGSSSHGPGAHTAVPVEEERPVITTFVPALIPEHVRPMVKVPVVRLNYFIYFFYWVAIIVVICVGGILVTVPSMVSNFGMLIQGVLTIVFVAAFFTIAFLLNVKRVDLGHQLRRLLDFCDGDITAATSLAIDVASDGSSETLSTAMAMMDTVNKVTTTRHGADAAAHPVQYTADEGGHADVAEPTTTAGGSASAAGAPAAEEKDAQADSVASEKSEPNEQTRLIAYSTADFRPVSAQLEEYRAAASEGTMASVQAEMEKDSLYIYDQTLKIVMKSALNVATLLPVTCFFAGYVLCKLGIEIKGVELVTIGFLLGLVGPTVWYTMQTRAQKELDEAAVAIKQHKAENQKRRELEEQQVRLREAELQREREVALVKKKELELQQVQAMNADTGKKEGEQKRLFGIPLPKLELPFQPKEGERENEDAESNDENV